jgi:hypothetical protein
LVRVRRECPQVASFNGGGGGGKGGGALKGLLTRVSPMLTCAALHHTKNTPPFFVVHPPRSICLLASPIRKQEHNWGLFHKEFWHSPCWV